MKYLKEKDRNRLEEVKKQGLEQLKSYTNSKKIASNFEDNEFKKVLTHLAEVSILNEVGWI